jgi:hypothetical protein
MKYHAFLLTVLALSFTKTEAATIVLEINGVETELTRQGPYGVFDEVLPGPPDQVHAGVVRLGDLLRFTVRYDLPGGVRNGASVERSFTSFDWFYFGFNTLTPVTTAGMSATSYANIWRRADETEMDFYTGVLPDFYGEHLYELFIDNNALNDGFFYIGFSDLEFTFTPSCQSPRDEFGNPLFFADDGVPYDPCSFGGQGGIAMTSIYHAILTFDAAPAPVPTPPAAPLLASGLAALALRRRLRPGVGSALRVGRR